MLKERSADLLFLSGEEVKTLLSQSVVALEMLGKVVAPRELLKIVPLAQRAAKGLAARGTTLGLGLDVALQAVGAGEIRSAKAVKGRLSIVGGITVVTLTSWSDIFLFLSSFAPSEALALILAGNSYKLIAVDIGDEGASGRELHRRNSPQRAVRRMEKGSRQIAIGIGIDMNMQGGQERCCGHRPSKGQSLVDEGLRAGKVQAPIVVSVVRANTSNQDSRSLDHAPRRRDRSRGKIVEASKCGSVKKKGISLESCCCCHVRGWLNSLVEAASGKLWQLSEVGWCSAMVRMLGWMTSTGYFGEGFERLRVRIVVREIEASRSMIGRG